MTEIRKYDGPIESEWAGECLLCNLGEALAAKRGTDEAASAVTETPIHDALWQEITTPPAPARTPLLHRIPDRWIGAGVVALIAATIALPFVAVAR